MREKETDLAIKDVQTFFNGARENGLLPAEALYLLKNRVKAHCADTTRVLSNAPDAYISYKRLKQSDLVAFQIANGYVTVMKK